MSKLEAIALRQSPVSSQGDLFKAETHWFHMFKSMIDNGDIAKLSGSAVKVYIVIKAHTNFSTGLAFPALETISEKAGLSVSQVKRELKLLEDAGYVIKEKHGRSNRYTLREKIHIEDGQGRPAAVATWDYLPSTVKHAIADLQNMLVTGEIAGARIVHIERLQINVNHLHDNAVNFNVQQFMADLANLPQPLREKILAGWNASQQAKSRDAIHE